MASQSASRLRSALSRIIAPQQQVHAEEEQRHASSLGGEPIAGVVARHPATLVGTLRSVTLRPRAGVPALEAALYDGSGMIKLIWLGRRQIAGIEPGRRIRVHGLVTNCEGEMSVFNPRYELIARD